jgi:predicted Zn-dependent protease
MIAFGERPLIQRALLWLFAAALALFALTRLVEIWSTQTSAEPPVRRSSAGAADYGSAVAGIDEKIAGLRSLAVTRPGDWVLHERIADQLIARARLTGDYRDLAEAQAALDKGFASATAGAGPHLAQAVLALTTHRLGLAERMLDATGRYAVRPDALVLESMRGDISFYHGRYPAALAGYAALPQPDQRLAIFRARTGQPEMALEIIGRIERTGLHTDQALAQLALLRGTIELLRGDWDAAEANLAEADRRFPGWWLAGAHRAQMLALRGRHAEAIRAFEALAANSSDPILRDALASLYRARGDYPKSRYWAEQAAQGWAERLKLLPEAAVGHAAEHELAFGTAARALALAQRDFSLRPHGATAVTLGWALIASSRPAEALRLMAAVDRSSWRSAEQHLVSARAYALLGRGQEARGAESKALAINPLALDPNAGLLWFGH